MMRRLEKKETPTQVPVLPLVPERLFLNQRETSKVKCVELAWRLAPVLLEGLRVVAELLVLLHIHAVGDVQVCAVEPSLLLVQDLQTRGIVLQN